MQEEARLCLTSQPLWASEAPVPGPAGTASCSAGGLQDTARALALKVSEAQWCRNAEAGGHQPRSAQTPRAILYLPVSWTLALTLSFFSGAVFILKGHFSEMFNQKHFCFLFWCWDGTLGLVHAKHMRAPPALSPQLILCRRENILILGEVF